MFYRLNSWSIVCNLSCQVCNDNRSDSDIRGLQWSSAQIVFSQDLFSAQLILHPDKYIRSSVFLVVSICTYTYTFPWRYNSTYIYIYIYIYTYKHNNIIISSIIIVIYYYHYYYYIYIYIYIHIYIYIYIYTYIHYITFRQVHSVAVCRAGSRWTTGACTPRRSPPGSVQSLLFISNTTITANTTIPIATTPILFLFLLLFRVDSRNDNDNGNGDDYYHSLVSASLANSSYRNCSMFMGLISMRNLAVRQQ